MSFCEREHNFRNKAVLSLAKGLGNDSNLGQNCVYFVTITVAS